MRAAFLVGAMAAAALTADATGADMLDWTDTEPPVSSDAPAAEPADEGSGGGWGPLVRFNAIWENDGSFPGAFSGDDRHYTNGLKFDLAWRPAWATTAAKAIPFAMHWDDHKGAFGLSFFQLMFTPEDLIERRVIPDDRPYAGWAGVAAYWQRAGALTDRISAFDHVELDLGVVGEWSQAGAMQRWVHNVFPDQDVPRGWGNQLGNEVVVNLTVRRKWRFSSDVNDQGFGIQVIPGVGGTLGTVYRHLEGDVTFRIGWRLPDDFGPTRLADVGAATGGWTSDWGVYAFIRGGGRVVQHNIFLDGSDFRDGHSVDKNTVVGEAQIGVALQLFRGLELGYSHTFLTKEFEDQHGSSGFGTFTIGYTLVF